MGFYVNLYFLFVLFPCCSQKLGTKLDTVVQTTLKKSTKTGNETNAYEY